MEQTVAAQRRPSIQQWYIGVQSSLHGHAERISSNLTGKSLTELREIELSRKSVIDIADRVSSNLTGKSISEIREMELDRKSVIDMALSLPTLLKRRVFTRSPPIEGAGAPTPGSSPGMSLDGTMSPPRAESPLRTRNGPQSPVGSLSPSASPSSRAVRTWRHDPYNAAEPVLQLEAAALPTAAAASSVDPAEAVEESEGQGGRIGVELFKVKLCRDWAQGTCVYGSRCIYAHSPNEMRTRDINKQLIQKLNNKDERCKIDPNKFKVRLCDKWVQYGECPYVAHCMFAHGPEEQRCVAYNREVARRMASLLSDPSKCIPCASAPNTGCIVVPSRMEA